MKSIMHTLAKKYNHVSSWFAAKYAAAINYLGVSDTDETRVFLAVTASVVLYVALAIITRICSLAYDAGELMLAIVNQ
jgi:hypothetical protein